MKRNYECNDGVCYLKTDNNDEKSDVPMPNKDDEWTLYGAKWCVYCKKSVELLEKNNFKYVYYDVDDYGVNNIKDQLSVITNNQKTIPIIFKNDEFIGGYTELCKLDIILN